jgi:coenzyme F420-reducing hydrogenase gamma subunit
VNGKPKVAVHKFSSCDGCQLAFLNAGEALLALPELLDIVHFAEAGMLDPDEPVDIAFVEGSVYTPEDLERIRRIRASSRYLISIGACATSGGIQALRNIGDTRDWVGAIYASPEYIQTLDQSHAIASQVQVDLELWGCPVTTEQVVAAIRALLFGVAPVKNHDKVCMDCKRNQTVCVLVARGEPCLGPVTGTGCGAICPAFGRDCYGCFGPSENPNTTALAQRFEGLGLLPADIARRFLFISGNAPAFAAEGRKWRDEA